MSDYTVGNAYLTVTPKLEDGSEGELKSKMTALGVAAGNLLANAVQSAVSAIGGELAKAFTNFAGYEQLVGGVETLFGAGGRSVEEYAASVGQSVAAVQGEYDRLMQSQEMVAGNAKDAFRTAGLSANDYMETVTGFSASLISSLGGDTVKAAEVADKAIVDMSDNANKMGSSMESIQNAYQGFAKQNYTMLDNLKLGYGGTKSEMERLLSDASELAGVEFNIDSYADVIEAIHVIQESMDIAGTTAKEGASTISGSVNMLHGAWENFLTAFGDGGRTMDFSKVTADLIESAGAVAKNVVPAIARIVSSAVTQLPGMLLEAVKSLPSLLGDAIGAAFGSEEGIGPVVRQYLGDGVADALEGLAEPLQGVVDAFGQVKDAVTESIAVAFEPVAAFVADTVVPAFGELAVWAVENLVPALQGLAEFVTGTVVPAIQELGAWVAEHLQPVFDGMQAFIVEHVVPALQQMGEFIMGTVVPDIQQLAEWVGEHLGPVFEGAKDRVSNHVVPALQDLAAFVMDNVVPAVKDMYGWFKDNILPVLKDVAEFVADNVLPVFKDIADFVLDSVVPALSDLFGWVNDNIVPVFETLAGVLETVVGWLIDVANHIGGAVEGAAAFFFGNGESADVPHYATGGIVSRATLFEAGERGSELVWPSYEPYLSKYADAIAAGIGGKGGVTIEINNPVVRETADVGRILEEANRKLSRAGAAALY